MQTFVWVHIDKIEFYIYDPSTSPSLPSVVYCYVLKNYYWFRAMSKRIGAFDILILIFFFSGIILRILNPKVVACLYY